MPWEISDRDGKFCVVKQGTQEAVPGGCHPDRESATAHMRALYANEPGAKTAGLSDPFPLDPPDEWFEQIPDWFEPGMKLTVITDGPEAGRVAATVADRRTYILGNGDPWRSPASPSQYRDAMQGDTYTASGKVIPTATLAAEVNHVPARASFTQARDAMANTGTALARVRFMDLDGHTIALGAAWPGLSDIQVRKMQAAALSGDWRWREEFGHYDMAGTIFVNTPGLPLPNRPVFQPHAMAASLGDPHPAVIGGWVCNDEGECHMAPEPTLTLTLPASEAAELHAIIMERRAQTAAAAPCTCGAHTAAPGDPMTMGNATAQPPAAGGGPVTREEFDALTMKVEELIGQQMSDGLAEVDGMVAALPLPPDLRDQKKHAMPPPFVKQDAQPPVAKNVTPVAPSGVTPPPSGTPLTEEQKKKQLAKV